MSAQKTSSLPFGFSTYLDLARLLAAFAVFYEHFRLADSDWKASISDDGVGHSAVVVFFVLSGYLIRYVADTREGTFPLFAASRIARIYSVAIPALVLTVAVDIVLVHLGHNDQVRPYQLAAPWKYLPIFVLFASDFWFINEQVFSNAPFWSLSYEVWYYVAFAVAFFVNRRHATLRNVLLFLLTIVVGPRLWILFPLWLLGVWIYNFHRTLSPVNSVKREIAHLLFFGSAVALCLYLWSGAGQALNEFSNATFAGIPRSLLRGSQFFASDFVVGLVVGINIFAARYCAFDFGRLRRAIVFLAGNSFTLYLTHYPLLEFLALVCRLKGVVLLASTLLSALLIGVAIERQKDSLRRGLLIFWDRRFQNTRGSVT